MMTRELAIGMMRQADTGAEMLTVAEAVATLAEDMNIASVDQPMGDPAIFASDDYELQLTEDGFDPFIQPEDEPEYEIDPAFAEL
jgi:hypothetical protein